MTSTETQNNDEGRININPFAPPDMRTLVYSPDIRVLISHEGKSVDVSRDIVRATIIRKENSVSTAFVTLANKEGRHSKNMTPMDRITIQLKRVRWIPVFSGYLDTVPFRQLYQGVITIKASCTLKRLLHTWWNPGLPHSAALFNQRGIVDAASGDGQIGGFGDSGLGSMIRSLLTEVGGWNPSQIHISNFPVEFFNFLATQIRANQAANQAGLENFKHMLLGDDISGGVGKYASYSSGAGSPGPISVGAASHVKEIIAAADEMGLGPSNLNLQIAQYQAEASATGAAPGGFDNQNVAKAFEGLEEGAINLRTATMNQDAAILGVACAIGESSLRNLANARVPESLRYPNEGLGSDHDSVGLFQQRNFAEWGCLPAESQVFTSHGPRPIVDVEIGDEVWSYDGQGMSLGKVTDWMMTGHKPLLTIHTAGRVLEVTDNHWIPVRRYFGAGRGANQFSGPKSEWRTIEVQAADIRPGDYLIVPHGMGDGSATTTPEGDPLTEGLMELVGLYLGDGNCDNNGRVEIAHGRGVDEDHMPHYRALIEKELGVVSHTDKRGTRTRFNSSAFRHLIDTWFKGSAHTKTLPGWTYRLEPGLQLALLRGYLDSDGSVDKLGRIRWLSVSRDLIEGVRHLCIQLGIPVGRVGVRKARTSDICGRTYQSKEAYSLYLSSPRHNHRISPHSPHKLDNITRVPKQLKSRYDEDWNTRICRRVSIGAPPRGTVYHKVASVSRGEVPVPVYDITVDGLHHYVADGIVVHNTVGQRMNPRQAARMFFEHLDRFDWRNTDPGQAIYRVQRGGSPAYYSGHIAQAKQLVQAEREAQQGLAAAATSNSLTGIPSTIAGAAGVDVTAAVNSAVNQVASAGTLEEGRARLGKPNPDSEGAVMEALAQIGKPYSWGGEGPLSFDCSGLFYWAFRAIKIDIGRDTGAQFARGTPVDPADLRRGDLIFTGYQGTIPGHVVMWMGDGSVLHAPTTGQLVSLVPSFIDMSTIRGIRRYADNGGPDPTAPRISPVAAGPGMPPGTGTTTGLGGGTGGTSSEPIARNLFSYIFEPANFISETAVMWGTLGGHKDFIDAQPLIQMVQAVCRASLRNFQSAPNGDFMAYYPDYFGLDGKPSILKLEDIELKNVSINFSDDQLTTHVYVAGDHNMIGQPDQMTSWIMTAGTATVEDEWLFQRLRQVGLGDYAAVDGNSLMQRFGVRPYQFTAAMAGRPELEFLLACQIFMEKWAAQYETQIQLAFMPELYPGTRIQVGDHNLQLYVHEVTHDIDFEGGFTTNAVVSAPSNPNNRDHMAQVRTPSATGPLTGDYPVF